MNKARSPQTLAKMIAYVLGRRPEEFGLVPDAEGWVRLKDLLKALHEEEGWRYVNATHLNEVRLTVAGPPFEIAEGRIRANAPRPADGPRDPDPAPKLLYACIRRRGYRRVLENGLKPSAHPQVVLCASREMAERMGRRLDPDPVLLTVQVQACRERGIEFQGSGQGLFLAPEVPAGCFSGPALPKETEAQKAPAEAAKNPPRGRTAGGFLLDPGDGESALVPKSLRGGGAKNGAKPKRGKTWTRERPPWRR